MIVNKNNQAFPFTKLSILEKIKVVYYVVKLRNLKIHEDNNNMENEKSLTFNDEIIVAIIFRLKMITSHKGNNNGYFNKIEINKPICICNEYGK